MATRRQSTQRKRRFLAAFANAPTISAACRESGVPRPTVYEWLERDETFASSYREIETAVRDSAIDEAYRRGVKGYDEPVFDLKTGKQVGTIRKYSDAMLSLLLRGWHPQTFRDPVPEQQALTIKVYQGVDLSRVVQPGEASRVIDAPAGDARDSRARDDGDAADSAGDAGTGADNGAGNGLARISGGSSSSYRRLAPPSAPSELVDTDDCVNPAYRNHGPESLAIAGLPTGPVIEGSAVVLPDGTDDGSSGGSSE